MRTASRVLLVGALSLLFLGALASVDGGVGPASAGHDPTEADATITPFDRTPGATNVKYGQRVVATAGTDLETLTRTLAVYEAGSWAGCGPNDAEVFGIDRGNDQAGYEIDEGLTDHVKSFSAGEDELDTEYFGEDDFGGASTHLNDGDELVSVVQCIDNPDDPGWYRIRGVTEGVNAEGESVTFSGYSHYFWICDCRDESAAREQLGPPPSERALTPTPTPTRTPTTTGSGRDEATATPSSDRDRAGTPAASGGNHTPTATRTRTPVPTPTPMPTATPPESWDVVVNRTPTPGSGAGFGRVVTLCALTVAVLLVRRLA